MSKSKSKSNEVAEKDKTGSAVMVFSDQTPDYLVGKTGNRGTENVGADDLVIPRLEIVQSLSPCRKREEAAYIQGAEEGMLFNHVTRELYGDRVVVIPVYYRKEYLIWKDRKQGGGFRGAYPTEAAAEERIRGEEDAQHLEAVDTGQFFCLLVKPDGSAEEIALSMARSKAKVARNWNSLIRLTQSDMFARAYSVSTVRELNQQKQDYYNLSIKPLGFPPKELYERAEKLYEQVAKGGVTIDHNVDDVGDNTSPQGKSEF